MTASKIIVNSISNEYDGARIKSGGVMKSDNEWVNLVKGILRAGMTRRAITYEELANRLAELGVNDSAVNLRNKVARGGFSAVFFMQCLKAIGCQNLRLEDG
jgi:hypothetical protein